MDQNKAPENDPPAKTNEPKDLQQANENIRKSEGDESTKPIDTRRSGHKPAFDRDR